MTVVTINPSASSHDAWQTGPGVMTLTDEIKLTAGTSWAGLLLPAVPVASADTINSATLYYKAYSATRDDPDIVWYACILYTSDAADERSRGELGGRRIIKKKKNSFFHVSSPV